MPSVSTIAQAEEVRKTSPEQAIPLYQSILAAAATGMFLGVLHAQPWSRLVPSRMTILTVFCLGHIELD